MNHFHNTVPLAPGEAAVAEVRAKGQDQRVLEYLMFEHPTSFTAEEIMEACEISTRSSISRALSNLFKKGLVEKVGRYAVGQHGVKINLWRYAQRAGQGSLFPGGE